MAELGRAALASTESYVSTLGELAEFLSSVARAWNEANHEQRNRLEGDSRRVLQHKGEETTPRGFEPLISTVTGWHVKPLHHGAV